MKVHFADKLAAIGACNEAVTWARDYPTAAKAWRECQRGDWMLWLLGRCSDRDTPERKAVVLACCGCARLSLPIWGSKYPDDQRPRAAIETAERYARDEGATLGEVQATASAAYAASATAYAAAYAAYAAASAAYAAAYAASAAYAAAYAASAASATATAAYAASATASAAVRTRVLGECAAIVRKHFPSPPRWVMKRINEEAKR